jgi:GTP cyclohydrolase I
VVVAYFSNGQVIGLSKLNRIVQYCSQGPQIQERLTKQIANVIKESLGTEDVAVIVDAYHHCVSLKTEELSEKLYQRESLLVDLQMICCSIMR